MPTIPLSSTRRAGILRRLSAGRIRHWHVRRQLQPGASHLDAGQRPDYSCFAAVLLVLRRRLQSGCPTGSGRLMTLYQVAEEITNRLSSMFLKDKDGKRPIYGGRTNSNTTCTGDGSCLLRVLPRRHGAGLSQSSNWLDWHHCPAHAVFARHHAGKVAPYRHRRHDRCAKPSKGRQSASVVPV